MVNEGEQAAPDSAPRDEADRDDLYSWAVSLGVSLPRLREVIAEVGDSAAAVRRRLAESDPTESGPADS